MGWTTAFGEHQRLLTWYEPVVFDPQSYVRPFVLSEDAQTLRVLDQRRLPAEEVWTEPSDVDGSTRLKTYFEAVKSVSPSSNVVTIDLSEAQTFDVDVTSAITQFTISNIPSESSSFTLKVSQDSTGGYAVGIDTFKDSGGAAIPVYWSGSVVPVVTTTASKTDIYNFVTFDGGSSFYGVSGGQNFG